MPHPTQVNLMKKRRWGLWIYYLTPLRCCFRFSFYLFLEPLMLCSSLAAAEEIHSPGMLSDANIDQWKVEEADRKVPLHFPFYVHFGARCFLYRLSADVASNRESLCLSMKQGPLVNAHAFISHSSCPIFFFAVLAFLNKVSVLKGKKKKPHTHTLKNVFCSLLLK